MKKHWVLWYGLGLLLLGTLVAPVIRPAFFAQPLFSTTDGQRLAQIGLIALGPLGVWLALRGEALGKNGRWAAAYVALAATAICEVIHYWVTDRGHYFPAAMFADNTAWQQFMHKPILGLEAAALPHSYRFLPDAIVRLFTWIGGDFVVARIAYRLLFNALLFAALFRLARTYVSPLLAGGAVVLVVAVYPITILKYAGQFVDPMSHLSFVACLFCLARRYEPGFGPSLFVGLFAKESVIVMALCRAFFGHNRTRAAFIAAGYLAVGAAIAWGIRVSVKGGETGYRDMSGMDLTHVPKNLAGWREWILLYVAAFGALLPGAILGWKRFERPFQLTLITLVAATIVSSLLFSWLSEVRNMMPAFVALAVANAIYLQHRLGGVQPNGSSAISAR